MDIALWSWKRWLMYGCVNSFDTNIEQIIPSHTDAVQVISDLRLMMRYTKTTTLMLLLYSCRYILTSHDSTSASTMTHALSLSKWEELNILQTIDNGLIKGKVSVKTPFQIKSWIYSKSHDWEKVDYLPHDPHSISSVGQGNGKWVRLSYLSVPAVTSSQV